MKRSEELMRRVWAGSVGPLGVSDGLSSKGASSIERVQKTDRVILYESFSIKGTSGALWIVYIPS